MEWQDIETAPMWQSVLVFQAEAPETKSLKTGVFTAVQVEGKIWVLAEPYGKRKLFMDHLDPKPTAWMPLPEPPK